MNTLPVVLPQLVLSSRLPTETVKDWSEELSIMLRELGYSEVSVDRVFYGMIGFHRAVKPLPA